ncbi:dipeptidase [Paenibacillus sp. IB182496]|uniref:Dipeptidase n=1 Tax=Paenibacillus sabuli TaxID=2772509 RepID=A0A927BTF3_9BACL|nr:dipeptidase [Paenibacillus sabuli]MBD2845209.1 dipeptidase [Paenibacillus sabuli]
MQIETVDFHCDVLAKMLLDKQADFGGQKGDGRLDVSYARLKEAKACLQVFAIYLPERLEPSTAHLLQATELFLRSIAALPGMRFVRTAKDLRECQASGKIGALLSLEGAAALQGRLYMVRIMQELGLRALGLTWNDANWAADGVMEPRQGGLTRAGRALVEECGRHRLVLDVSHLTERGFWEVAECSASPLIASHSNAYACCKHPRNLTDAQIRALAGMDGRIGITYVPQFLNDSGAAAIDDVLRHIEHICTLGGAKQLVLGSDFDGIDRHVRGLAHPGHVPRLLEALLKRYDEPFVRGIAAEHALRFLSTHLPPE